MNKTGVLRLLTAGAWCAAAPLVCMNTAWGDEVRIVTPPATSAGTVTIVNQPAAPPAQQVTVVEDSTREMTIRHEAVVDVDDDSVSSVIVKTEPPAPREEVVRIEQRPAEGYTWVSGYWRWDADRNTYEWVPGVWRRTVPGMTFHPGRWVKFENGYQWAPGYWTTASGEPATATVTTAPAPATTTTTTTTVDTDADRDTDLIVVKKAPPAPREETRTTSPGADYVWISGHWEYRDGDYTWISGRWERPAAEGMLWVPARWIRLADGSYTYISGHWDYPVESRAYVVSRDSDEDDIVDRSSNLEKDNKEINNPTKERDGDNR